MAVRIVTDEEVRQALRDNRAAKLDRETALNELAELRAWFTEWTPGQREWAENPKYPLELIGMIEDAIKTSWPMPLGPEDLR
jgi:hypothetical protein